MPLDSLSYTGPARLRALLCPLGRIRRSRFEDCTARLCANNIVRLGDVTPDPQRPLFSPQGYPDGRIVYDLSTSLDREHDYLESFELYRRVFVVIAIADHLEENDPETLAKDFDELKFLYPNAIHFVCLLFDAPSTVFADNPTLKSKYAAASFIPVPPKRESRNTSMRTVMCDITSPLLSELCTFAKSLQALPGLESPLFGEEKSAGAARDHRLSVPVGGGLGALGESASLARKRTTMTGFGSGSTTDRTRSKGKGRIQIAIAQLHLMCGRTPDALKELVEGAETCRANNDHLWHGKALEGIGVCLVILAHLRVNFQIPQIPYPAVEVTKGSAKSPPPSKPNTPTPAANGSAEGSASTVQRVLDLLPELHNHVTNLYQRAANFPGEGCPHICYSEAALRYAKALTSLHLASGTAEVALENIVLGTKIPIAGLIKNTPSRMEIATTVMGAYPQPVESMTVLEATRVLSGIASVFAAIGMKRRRALITRELLKILIPGLIQARVVGAAEVGVHPAAGLSALSGAGHGGTGSPLDLGEGDVECGIMEMLEDICRTYGILPVSALTFEDDESQRPLSIGTATLRTAAVTKSVIAEHETRMFGWSALKIHVLRNCMSLCEALPDFQGVLKFTTQLLRMADTELSREDQVRLSTTISRTVGAARKLGLPDVEADYWDQFLLRDVELVDNSTWPSPISHNKNDILEGDPENPPSAPTAAERNPFIYNPAHKKEGLAAEQLLVKGEMVEFRVTLQNPFEFEVEVEGVTLDSSGVELVVQQASVVLGPFRTFQVSVFATPSHVGEIQVTGCKIRVYGCRERSFPIFTEGLDSRERDRKRKRYGLKAAEPEVERPMSTVSAGGRSSLRPPPVLHPIPKFLSLSVVESQPMLVVHSTTLSQNAIMILEGERRRFDVTFKNLSPVDVDLLAFSFEDSTTARIHQALIEKGNSPAESYELELMLAKKRAFKWIRSKSSKRPGGEDDGEPLVKDRTVYVEANGTATFQVEVLGKPGLTHGVVQTEYSHLGCPRSEIEGRFFTRQVSYPVTITVNASIELVRVDFVPFSTDLPPSTTSSFPPLQALLSRSEPRSEHCLMLLDLRNAWPQPLHVTLKNKDSEPLYVASETIQAGHTTRIILPVKRVYLPNPTLPIPTLSRNPRQFVVSSTKISLETERQSREAFWYREELLASLSGTWEEPGTDRAGAIELRGIRLSPRMVETLRVEDIGITLSVAPSSAARQLSLSTFMVKTDEFLTLRTTITNRTSRRLRPMLRILPALRDLPMQMALDLNRRFAVNGLLQQVLDPLEADEARTVEHGFVVLAKGRYEVSASIEEVGVQVVKEVTEELDSEGRRVDVLRDVKNGGGRRCWVCREICGIVARDCGASDVEEGHQEDETGYKQETKGGKEGGEDGTV